MTLPTSPEVDLFDGLAVMLDTAGIGVYKTSGIYSAGERGIVTGGYAVDPTEQIVLTTYLVQDDPPPANDSILGVQVMLRGTQDPRSVKNVSGAIFDLFQGLARLWFGSPQSIYLVEMWRQSGRLDGKDENERGLSSENYYARCNWPTAHRTE
jgi:hypothetical protein